MNRAKKQGTAAESRIVEQHKKQGLAARRLAEGGSADEGDVEVYWSSRGASIDEMFVRRVVGEVKDCERLNAPKALEKAVAKSGTNRTALFLTQREDVGNLRRITRRCIVIPEEFWFELIGGNPTSAD
jgi:hypothetical protein